MATVRLIALEGVAGCGVRTQAQHLVARLAEDKISAVIADYPPAEAVDKIIGMMPAGNPDNKPGYATEALISAALRQNMQEREIHPNMYNGQSVVCRRYSYTSVIYHSLMAGDPAARTWIKQINHHITVPHLTIYFRIDARTAAARQAESSGGTPSLPQLQKLVDTYDSIGLIFPDHRIVTLDGTQSISKIANDVYAKVRPMF